MSGKEIVFFIGLILVLVLVFGLLILLIFAFAALYVMEPNPEVQTIKAIYPGDHGVTVVTSGNETMLCDFKTASNLEVGKTYTLSIARTPLPDDYPRIRGVAP